MASSILKTISVRFLFATLRRSSPGAPCFTLRHQAKAFQKLNVVRQITLGARVRHKNSSDHGKLEGLEGKFPDP